MRYHVNFRDLQGQAASDETREAGDRNAGHDPAPSSPDQGAFHREAAKLHRHLADYQSELVDVWGSVERLPRNGGFVAHLRVHLPSGTISAEGRAYTRLSAWTEVTNELIVRIERHKARLSGSRIRRRRRERDQSRRILFTEDPAPTESAPAASTGPQVALANAYPALLEYLTGEIERHEATGDLVPRTVDASDLIDETALIVLDRPQSKPDDVAFDHWIFKVAHERVLDQINRARVARDEATPSLDTVIDRLEGPEGFTDEDDLVRELIGPNPRRRYGYDIPAPVVQESADETGA